MCTLNTLCAITIKILNFCVNKGVFDFGLCTYASNNKNSMSVVVELNNLLLFV